MHYKPRAWRSGHRTVATMLVSWLAMLLSSPAVAQNVPDLGQMFANFGKASTDLMDLTVWAGGLIGIFLLGYGIIKLVHHAENPQQTRLTVPIFLLFVGACLVAIPGSIDTVTSSMALGAGMGPTLLSQPNLSGAPPGIDEAIAGILLFVKLIGHIAFVYGFVLLKGVAMGDRDKLGRATTHILAGAACINIGRVALLLGATLAPGMDLGGLGG